MAEQSNGRGVAIVRITHRELVEMAENCKISDDDVTSPGSSPQLSTFIHTKDEVTSKVNGRKPNVEPYRPGNGLLPKRKEKQNTNACNSTSDNSENEKPVHSNGFMNTPPSSPSAVTDTMSKDSSPGGKSKSTSPAQQDQIAEKDKKVRKKRPDMELYKPKARLHMDSEKEKNVVLDKASLSCNTLGESTAAINAKAAHFQQRKSRKAPSSNSSPVRQVEGIPHTSENVEKSPHFEPNTWLSGNRSCVTSNVTRQNEKPSCDYNDPVCESGVVGSSKLTVRQSRRSLSESNSLSSFDDAGNGASCEQHVPRSRSVRTQIYSNHNFSNVNNEREDVRKTHNRNRLNIYDSAVGMETSNVTDSRVVPQGRPVASDSKCEVGHKKDLSGTGCKTDTISCNKEANKYRDTKIPAQSDSYREQQQYLKQLYEQQKQLASKTIEADEPQQKRVVEDAMDDDWIRPKHIVVPPLPSSVWSKSQEEVKQTLLSLRAADGEQRRERRGRGRPVKEKTRDGIGCGGTVQPTIEPLVPPAKEQQSGCVAMEVEVKANDRTTGGLAKTTAVHDLPKQSRNRNTPFPPTDIKLQAACQTSKDLVKRASGDNTFDSKHVQGRNSVSESHLRNSSRHTEISKSNKFEDDTGEGYVSRMQDEREPDSPVIKVSPKLDWGEEVERAERVKEQESKPASREKPDKYTERVKEQESRPASREKPVKSARNSSREMTHSIRTTPTCEVETSDPESPISPLKDRHSKSTKKKKKVSDLPSSSHKKSSSRKSRDAPEVSKSASRLNTKSGGIIHLPNHPLSLGPHGENMNSDLLRPASSHSPPILQRHLFDPNNPSMPQVVTYQPNTMPHTVYRRQSDPYSGVSDMPSPSTPLCIDPHAMMYPGYVYPGYPVPHMEYYHPVPLASPPAPADLRGMPTQRKMTTAQRNIYEATLLENDLNCYLAIPFDAVDHKKFGQCRWKIQLRYENAILADVEFCTKHNIEQSLWKAAYYQVIETYRKQIVDLPHLRDDIRKSLLALIEEGTIFYENLLDKLQDKYSFSLLAFLDSEAVRPTSLPEHVKMALISAQKMIICLGDLARYQEQANDSVINCSYGKARNWYLKAQQLAPKNGRPYNQLAIIALHMKRKLDAVYYYMRSLAASSPFHTARDSLISLFDEARKKYEVVKKLREEQRGERGRDQSKSQQRLRFQARQEVWVREDGSSSELQQQPEITDPSDEELNSLTAVDLSKKFALSFLHAHGKLFTKIGMDTFVNTAAAMLREFRCILKHRPLAMGSARLVQLMAINMFIIHHTEVKVFVNMEELWSSMQMNALQLSLDMFAVMLHECLVLLKEHLASDDYPAVFLTDDIQALLPSIKVWCDWLMCHLSIWNPPPPKSDFCNSELEDDVWSLLAQLATVVKKMDLQGVQLIKERTEGWEPVVLPEDLSLAGFVPLLGLPQDSVYTAPPVNKDLVHNVLRLQRLQFCADFLDGIEPPVLYYDVQRKGYVSLVGENGQSGSPASDEEMNSMTEYNSSQVEDSHEESEDGTDERDPARERSEIDRLRLRKEELKRRKADQEKHKRQIQDVLHNTKKSRVILRVDPRYLVPDTNCFIDHLPEIRQLVENNPRFLLIVPLVVVNELEGLAKSCKTPRGGSGTGISEHNRQVVAGAKAGLDYLKQVFDVKHPHVKAVTSKGSELDTITFRSEDLNENMGTNDDQILRCCLQYCNASRGGKTETDKDGVCRITRRVVLLTDDRNLRLKALTADVPSRDVPTFFLSAEIGRDGD